MVWAGIAERLRQGGLGAAAVVCALAAASPGLAETSIRFTLPGAGDSLSDELRAASAVAQAQANGTTDAQDLFAAARSEYARLLGVLYARGHYSAVIRVLVDGREAAGIAPLDAPARIDRIEVIVDPGPTFAFGTARIAPLPRGVTPPPDFAPGKTAESGRITGAAEAGIEAWRDRGHAKARVTAQDIVADHAARRLDADLRLDPGPRLRFGPLTVTGNERMRLNRIIAIAGLPEGRRFSPATLDRVADRLRRTGIFSSVTLTEGEAILPPDLLPIGLAVAEQKPRRYSLGGELSSLDGATLSASWLHRNLAGGGERLRLYGEIAQIGAQESGIDYTIGLTLERPATFTPDTTVGVSLELSHLDEDDYTGDTGTLGLTATQYVSSKLTLRAALQYDFQQISDLTGNYTYRTVALPVGLLWDSRDKPLDARKGSYLDAEAKPFFTIGDNSDAGLRLRADARGYLSPGTADRVTFAARLQAGAVFGPGLLDTPRGELFYSGGAGTVRGQPYQSLGVSILRSDFEIGGQAFLGASAEARLRITDTIGAVAFFDWGHVGGLNFFDDLGDSHSGAGLGLRYDTGVGPIRLDIAAPVSGGTGDGAQIYIGIGQAF